MKLTCLPKGTVRLTGPMGKALDTVIEKRLKRLDYVQLVDPFRRRDEADWRWRCEFWGKSVRAAIYAWRSTQDGELLKIIKETVKDLLSTRREDGAITSYPPANQCRNGWDVWGRKYALLGLLAYYQEVDPDPAVKEAVLSQCLRLIEQVPDRLDLVGEQTGFASCSILRGLVEASQLDDGPKGRKIFAYAKHIAEDLACSCFPNIFRACRGGADPAEIGSAKSYELTSCYQGLLAMYAADGDEEKLDFVKCYYEKIRDQEIMLTGTGGLKDTNGEFWFHGATRQTYRDFGALGETCVTVTWLGLCRDLLKLTGDTLLADEMERSFYNALLGSMTPDGTNFIHRNPYLDDGWKKAALDQMPDFPGHDCCRDQAPYGMAMAPLVAVMRSDCGYAVNLYEDLKAEGILKIEGNYPSSDRITVTILRDGDFEIAFRAPKDFAMTVNGCAAQKGRCYRLRKTWKTGDKVDIAFDFSPRKFRLNGFTAELCGPLVMCEETNAPGIRGPIYRSGKKIDYASAGLAFCEENRFKVFF